MPPPIQVEVRRRASELGITPSSASNPAGQQHPWPGVYLEGPEIGIDDHWMQFRMLEVLNPVGRRRSEPGRGRRPRGRPRPRPAHRTIQEPAFPPGERMSYFSRRNRSVWSGLSSRSVSLSPPPPPTRSWTPTGSPIRTPAGTRTRMLTGMQRQMDEELFGAIHRARIRTTPQERWFEAWKHHKKNRIRSRADYKFLMEQIEPLTQLGEEQEKLEFAMQNLSNSRRKQGLRIWFRMWVAWVPRRSAASNDEESEHKLDEISREMVERDRVWLRWEKQACAIEDGGAVVDRDLEEEEIKAMLEKQELWAYELDKLDISSQVAWEMQINHGVGWAILGHDDDGHGQYLVGEPGDLIVPAFNEEDLLELPELWIQVAPGKAGPANEDTPMGKEGRIVTSHPPFLPICIVFDGLRLYRAGKLYAGYIEYRTDDLEYENAPRARLILCVHRHGRKLGQGNGSTYGEEYVL